jgi:hypothetical protein
MDEDFKLCDAPELDTEVEETSSPPSGQQNERSRQQSSPPPPEVELIIRWRSFPKTIGGRRTDLPEWTNTVHMTDTHSYHEVKQWVEKST